MWIKSVFSFIALLSLLATPGCGDGRMSFEKTKWASGKGNYSGKNPRIEMVSDAKAAGVKIGATREQVRDLLGEPDSSDTSIDTWYLGRSTYAPDYTTLDVYYDEKAIVTKIGSTQS
jgi:outer membrane protein assembly factor BamE (lipoprotein component of BamABCDE complex)